jgi:hypothetical protein
MSDDDSRTVQDAVMRTRDERTATIRFMPDAISVVRNLRARLEGEGREDWVRQVDAGTEALGRLGDWLRPKAAKALDGWIDFERERAAYRIGHEQRLVEEGRVLDDDDDGQPIPGSTRAEASPFDVLSVLRATSSAERVDRTTLFGVDCDVYRGETKIVTDGAQAQDHRALPDLWSARKSMGIEVRIDDAGRIRAAYLTYAEASGEAESARVTTLHLARFGNLPG